MKINKKLINENDSSHCVFMKYLFIALMNLSAYEFGGITVGSLPDLNSL